MRLVDMVVQARGPLEIVAERRGLMRLPGVEQFADELSMIPTRYVLMDDVTGACGDLILRQPELLASSIDLLRAPAERLWLEWRNSRLPRPDARTTAPRQRVGLLVHAARDGRSGAIRSFHENEVGGVDYYPGVMRFDLDAPPRRSPPCPPAYRQVLATSWLEVDPEWMDCYRVSAGSDVASLRTALNTLWQTGFKDLLILYTFCLLLRARAELQFAAPDLEKLNQARAKRGKPPLLHHIEVSAPIFRPAYVTRHGTSGARSEARLHHVRGHWVRRQNALFWRRAHLRGSAALGLAPVRTTRLHLGTAPAMYQ